MGIVEQEALEQELTDKKRSCPVCDSNDFVNVDYLRVEPCDMEVCKNCGMVSHRYFTSEEMLNLYYKDKYRAFTVNASFISSANRKLGYHISFLSDYFEKKKGLVCCDIGAGIGYVLEWLRQAYQYKVYGVEKDDNLRRFCKNTVGVTLTTEFDESKKYDFVSIYHTLEHVFSPKDLLRRVKNCLTKDGVVYISVPIWMEELYDSAGGIYKDFDNYFHKAHISSWSSDQIKGLMASEGWEIFKEDRKRYGYTFLARPTEKKGEIHKRDYREVVEQLSDMQRASHAFTRNDYKEAIRLYPRFTDAYMATSQKLNGNLDAQLQILEVGRKLCPNTLNIEIGIASILQQYGRYEESVQIFSPILQLAPHKDSVLYSLAVMHLKMGDAELKKGKIDECKRHWKESINLFTCVLKIDKGRYPEVYQYMGYILSLAVMEGEDIIEKETKLEAIRSSEAKELEMNLG